MQITEQKPETALRLWTVEEYRRMAEAGILQPDERVELVAGKIIRTMSPQGTPHAAAITRVDRLLRTRIQEPALVRIQLPLELSDRSQPEPDLAAVKVDPLDYDDRHPTPEDVYLIIEIADTTLSRDCGLKARDYANYGIIDYWVLDVNNRRLHVFREPTKTGGFSSEAILAEGETVSPLRFPGCRIAVSEMLRPS